MGAHFEDVNSAVGRGVSRKLSSSAVQLAPKAVECRRTGTSVLAHALRRVRKSSSLASWSSIPFSPAGLMWSVPSRCRSSTGVLFGGNWRRSLTPWAPFQRRHPRGVLGGAGRCTKRGNSRLVEETISRGGGCASSMS
ncbi:hypothetical protein MRX96_010187 [Rhipicephalus microplus]